MKNCTVAAEQSGSTKMVKTNSLRQFNYAQILGVPTAAGMKPVIYPIWLHSKCPGGVRGIVFYGGTFSGRCNWYDQNKVEEECEDTFVYKYNSLETIVDEEKGETSFQRHKGYAHLNFPKKKTVYKGMPIYKAPYTIRGCDNDSCCYGYPIDNDNEVETPLEIPRAVKQKTKKKHRITTHSGCGCGSKK